MCVRVCVRVQTRKDVSRRVSPRVICWLQLRAGGEESQEQARLICMDMPPRCGGVPMSRAGKREREVEKFCEGEEVFVGLYR